MELRSSGAALRFRLFKSHVHSTDISLPLVLQSFFFSCVTCLIPSMSYVIEPDTHMKRTAQLLHRLISIWNAMHMLHTFEVNQYESSKNPRVSKCNLYTVMHFNFTPERSGLVPVARLWPCKEAPELPPWVVRFRLLLIDHDTSDGNDK